MPAINHAGSQAKKTGSFVLDKLRATVLGLKDAGADLCAAVSSDPGFELVAVADGDKKIVDNTAEAMEARGYDDYRSAIVEPDAQVIFMAMPPYLRPEYLKLGRFAEIPGFHVGTTPAHARGMC